MKSLCNGYLKFPIVLDDYGKKPSTVCSGSKGLHDLLSGAGDSSIHELFPPYAYLLLNCIS